MGWVPREDEETGVDFALPPPASGPEETRREGKDTAVASRAYAGRAGDITISAQFLSTPENPGSLAKELPPEGLPRLVIEQIEAAEAAETAQGGAGGAADYEAELVSNDRLEEADQPTYDAHLRVSSPQQEAVWRLRTRAFDEFVLVTQVVAFPEGDADAEVERQVEMAFRQLNSTVGVPSGVQ
jgi:hypothetical protein